MILSIRHVTQHTQHGRDADATGSHDDFSIRFGQNVAESAEGALIKDTVSLCDPADMPRPISAGPNGNLKALRTGGAQGK